MSTSVEPKTRYWSKVVFHPTNFPGVIFPGKAALQDVGGDLPSWSKHNHMKAVHRIALWWTVGGAGVDPRHTAPTGLRHAFLQLLECCLAWLAATSLSRNSSGLREQPCPWLLPSSLGTASRWGPVRCEGTASLPCLSLGPLGRAIPAPTLTVESSVALMQLHCPSLPFSAHPLRPHSLTAEAQSAFTRVSLILLSDPIS